MDTTNFKIKELMAIEHEAERLRQQGQKPPEVIDSVKDLRPGKRQYLKLTNSERRQLKRLTPEQRRVWLLQKAGLSNA